MENHPTENSNLKKCLVFLSGAFILLCIGVSYYFVSLQNKDIISDNEQQLDGYLSPYGLNEAVGADDVLLGVVSITRYQEVAPAEGEDTAVVLPYVYLYDVASETESLVSFLPTKEAVALDEGAGEYVAIMTETAFEFDDSDDWQPYLYNTFTETKTPLPHVSGHFVRDLAVSPDRAWYSYSFIADPAIISEEDYLGDWSIAVHPMGGGEPIIVKGGAQAAWVDGGKSLLYVAHDGIYQYSLASETSVLVSGEYSSFGLQDQLVVNPAGTFALVLVSKLKIISVNSIVAGSGGDTLSWEEKGRFIFEDQITPTLVFLNNSFYASIKNMTGNFEEKSIRYILNSTIIK